MHDLVDLEGLREPMGDEDRKTREIVDEGDGRAGEKLADDLHPAKAHRDDPVSVPQSLVLPRRKADGPLFLRFGRGHELPNGVEHNLELGVILFLKRRELAGQFSVRGKQPA